MDKQKLDIDAIEELETTVAVGGHMQQREVGGPMCMGVVIGIAIAIAN